MVENMWRAMAKKAVNPKLCHHLTAEAPVLRGCSATLPKAFETACQFANLSIFIGRGSDDEAHS